MEQSTHGPDNHDRLGAAMALLSPQSRRVAELWLQGLSRKEIATAMRIDEGAAAVVCNTAIQRLRDLLAECSTGATR